MKGLVGKKLGMTQLFDEESGGVTPVTVIQAGPCPVVAVRTPDTDGYEAVQLAWEPVVDRKTGHLCELSGPPRAPSTGPPPGPTYGSPYHGR